MNFFWKEKKLKTVWRLDKEGHSGLLVGTTHFCPYRFERSLARLIQKAEIILFEGPLGQESMERVAHYGKHRAFPKEILRIVSSGRGFHLILICRGEK